MQSAPDMNGADSMTIEVKIKPAGHRLKIEMAEGPADDRKVTVTELAPGPVEATY